MWIYHNIFGELMANLPIDEEFSWKNHYIHVSYQLVTLKWYSSPKQSCLTPKKTHNTNNSEITSMSVFQYYNVCGRGVMNSEARGGFVLVVSCLNSELRED
jgi:hypothetical protein